MKRSRGKRWKGEIGTRKYKTNTEGIMKKQGAMSDIGTSFNFVVIEPFDRVKSLSADDLISDIKQDIADSREKLDDAVLKELRDDDFFCKPVAECRSIPPTVDADR